MGQLQFHFNSYNSSSQNLTNLSNQSPMLDRREGDKNNLLRDKKQSIKSCYRNSSEVILHMSTNSYFDLRMQSQNIFQTVNFQKTGYKVINRFRNAIPKNLSYGGLPKNLGDTSLIQELIQ